jgi:murein L,D-transpeptidase YcbB/YkuD
VKWLFILCIALAVTGCSHLREPAFTTPDVAEMLVIDTASIEPASLHMPASVFLLYKENQFKPVWFDTLRLNTAGDSLFHLIQKAAYVGLLPDDYHLGSLTKLLRDTMPGSLRTAEVLLSDSYFTLRHHLKYGRLDVKSLARTDLSRKVDDAGIALLKSTGQMNLIGDLLAQQPTHQEYRVLKDSLKTYLDKHRTDSFFLNRISQLKLNLERWRLTKRYPSRYLRVNIPAYMLTVVEHDTVVLRSNVIVGKPENRTPLLESTVTSFIIYPYWHVPPSIAAKEILPAIQYDPAYVEKHNYDVLDRNGNVVDHTKINWLMLYDGNFPYVLRQRDGKENTLGIIKFLFNNNYNVYLHDTNGKRLFSKEMRALSHGCVRVQKATELAHFLVKDDSIYITPDDLDQYLSLQQRYRIDVRKPIPLFIQYFTVEPGKGKLSFYQDIYKKDSVMQRALEPMEMQQGQSTVLSGL